MRRTLLLALALFVILPASALAVCDHAGGGGGGGGGSDSTGSAYAYCGAAVFNWSSFGSSGSGNGGRNTPSWKVVFTPAGGGASSTQSGTASFSGAASGPVTEAIPAVNGTVVASSSWSSSQTRDGQSGSWAMTLTVSGCPSVKIVKQQQVAGSGAPFTTAPVTADVGQTINYRVNVTNTGSVPVSLGFSDPLCDAGTVSGPTGLNGSGTLSPGATGVYSCTHLLRPADTPRVTNTATVTAKPPSGPSVSGSSSVVADVTVPLPAPTRIATDTPTPSSPGVPSQTPGSPKTPRTPTACATSSRNVVLTGHTGNVRSPFTARLTSAGVSRVTFSLDGRAITTLRHSKARHGRFSVRINPGRLSVGRHRLTVRVALSSKGCKPVSRSLVFVRSRRPVSPPNYTG